MLIFLVNKCFPWRGKREMGLSAKFPGHGKLTLEMIFLNPWHMKLWLIQKVTEISGRWVFWKGLSMIFDIRVVIIVEAPYLLLRPSSSFP